jgi:putative transposase
MLKIKRTYKFRLYPTRVQREHLFNTIRVCKELYNDALQEKRDAYKTHKVSISCFDQINQLPEIKTFDIGIASLYSQVAQDVLKRLDKTYKAFFSRIKKGTTAGFPRFKNQNSYNSFTYPGSGFKMQGKQLSLSKIGNIRIKQHREITGKIKTCTIKNENGKFYAIFSCECEAISLPETYQQIGIDMGISSFLTTSKGQKIDNPRWFRKSQADLRRKQRAMERCKRGSIGKKRAKLLVAKLHKHIFNQRNDFQHKLSTDIIRKTDFIVVEDLKIRNMSRNKNYSKSIMDSSWGSFISKLAYKAEWAGKQLTKVNPKNTSQVCPCGNPVPKSISIRWHLCPSCNLSCDRDQASAIEILRLGLSRKTRINTTPIVFEEAPSFSYGA